MGGLRCLKSSGDFTDFLRRDLRLPDECTIGFHLIQLPDLG